MEKQETRIDKYLWAVRLFKSRSAASEACKKGRVTMAGHPVKPSHDISVGEMITVRKPPVTYTYRVTGIPDNRLGAKLVTNYLLDLTPDDEKNKVKPDSGMFFGYRPRGTGRPTKRERRDIEDFLE